LAQDAQPQEVEPAADMVAEAEPHQELQPQGVQATEALPALVMEAFAQVLEDARGAGEQVADITVAMADGEGIKTSTVGG